MIKITLPLFAVKIISGNICLLFLFPKFPLVSGRPGLRARRHLGLMVRVAHPTFFPFSPFRLFPLILQIHHRHPGVVVGVEVFDQGVVLQVVPDGPFEAAGAHPVDDVHPFGAVEHRLVDEPVHQR
jgi:hypothetical protein